MARSNHRRRWRRFTATRTRNNRRRSSQRRRRIRYVGGGVVYQGAPLMGAGVLGAGPAATMQNSNQTTGHSMASAQEGSKYDNTASQPLPAQK